MSTPNFYTKNASKTFAVLLNEYDEETEQVIVPDGYDLEDLTDSIISILEDKGFDITEVNKPGRATGRVNRSYSDYVICEVLSNYKAFGNIEFCVNLTVLIRQGYYEGGCLDWELSYDGGEWLEFPPDTLPSFECYSDMNPGMQKIQSKNADKWLEKMADFLIDEVEEVFYKVSKPLHCIGVASNGEAFYEPVT